MTSIEALNAKCIKLRRYTKVYDPSKYTAEVLAENKAEWAKDVKDTYDAVLNCAEELEAMPAEARADSAEVERVVDAATESLQQFLQAFNQKCGLASTTAANSAAPIIAQKAKEALIDVRINAEKVDCGVSKLRSSINKFVDWSEAPSHDIEVAMTNVESWEKQLKEQQDLVWAMRRDTEVYDLDPAETQRCEGDVNALKAEVEDAIEKIRFEDVERALYSLNQAAAVETEYPNYGGELEENFVRFQKEFLHTLKVNRVRADKQVAKLRDCLYNGPKDLIPATMTILQTALDILAPIYGDPARLIESRKANIQDLGVFPEMDDYPTAAEVRTMIEWLVKFEYNILELYDLAATSDEHKREVFSMTTYKELLRLFNLDTVQKLAQSAGSVRDKVDDVYQYAVEKRETLQRSLRYLPDG